MKLHRFFTLLVILVLAVFTFSCDDDYDSSGSNVISQLELDKNIVQVNVTNVATGLQSVFNTMTNDSITRAKLCQFFVDSARYFDDGSGYFLLKLTMMPG